MLNKVLKIKTKIVAIVFLIFLSISLVIVFNLINNRQEFISNKIGETYDNLKIENQSTELIEILYNEVEKERKRMVFIYIITLVIFFGINVFLLILISKRFFDSSDRKEMEKYKILVENLNNVIFSIDKNEEFNYISPSIKKLLNYHPEEFIGQHFTSTVYAQDKAFAVNRLMDLKNNIPVSCIFEIRMQRKTAEFVWVNVEFRRILIKGEISGFQGVISNITKAKLAEEEVKSANEKILKQQTSITDSIIYARKIQRAVLPRPEYMRKCFSDYFVFFKPRDIVSGDFYWITRKAATIMVAVADCTGHGVPGAFMSILGMAFLNDVLRKNMKSFFEGKLKASDMLENLRKTLKKALRQTSIKTSETKDGMDMVFCIIDLDTNELQFAGAYNPLIIIRNNEMMTFKADRNPIGIFIKETPFTNNNIQLMKGDMLYMFSDGYADQFGGEKGHKFQIKNFKNLLMDIHQKPMEEQKQILKDTFEDWRGERPQIDDVLVMGVMIE